VGVKVRILRSDLIEKLSSKLKSKYKTTIFDFAYLLAIALNDEFLPQANIALGTGELRHVRRTLCGLKKILENKKAKLTKYDFLKKLLVTIDKCLLLINKEMLHIYRQPGRAVKEKTKLTLLWAQLLVRRREKSLRKPIDVSFEGTAFQIKGKMIESIDWGDYYTLLAWFYERLRDCSYSFYIKPKADRQKEKDYAKSLLEKNYASFVRRANEAVWMLKLAQNYFRKKGSLPLKIGPPGSPKFNAYPLIKVCFKKDTIETAELRKKGIILIKKVGFLDKQKTHFRPEKKRQKIQYPTVIFPNEERLIITNYTPPSFPSIDERGQLLEEFIKEISKRATP
jgi:hypothetical protein